MIVVTKTFHRVFTSVFFVHCWQHETIQVPALPGWHIEKCRCTYHSLKSVEEIVGEDHQFSNRSCICSSTARALQNDLPPQPSMCIIPTKVSDTDSTSVTQRPQSFSGTCANRLAPCSLTGIPPEKTRAGRFATGALFSSVMKGRKFTSCEHVKDRRSCFLSLTLCYTLMIMFPYIFEKCTLT